jgi:ribose transport system ATP-binding protein
MVEILKALSADAKLIIMDEPTSSLSASESEKLFDTIDGLRKKGAGILYVSHRLEEVYRLSDRLTVMRDGKIVAVLGKEAINAKTVTTMMIGHEPRQVRARAEKKLFENNRLEVRNLSYGKLLRDVNFTAYGGEILGIGGLVGSGRTELIRCIYGAAKQDGGEILFNGKPVPKHIAKNIRMGFGLVPEDRRVEGFIPVQSMEKNIAIASHDRLSKMGFMNARREAHWAEDAIKNYDIRPKNRHMPVANLSGGNQQKVVLGRWLSRDPKLLLLDEPTVGVDVGVKADLYDFMRRLAQNGAIIIMVSSDLFELTHISDRILVMHDGRFFEEFTHENVSQTSILLASSGEHTEEGRAI